MYLIAAIQSFEIVLTESEGSPRSRWTVTYQDVNGVNFAGKPVVLTGYSNGTTKVTLFFGPAAGYVRRLIRFSWNNQDTATHHVTVQLNDGMGNLYPETGPPTILPKQSLLYHTKKGWYVFPKPCTGYPVSTQFGGTGAILDGAGVNGGGPGWIIGQPTAGGPFVPQNSIDCGTF